MYQYIQNNMVPHPAQNYIVLRTWGTDLPNKLYSLSLSSMDHHRAPAVSVRVNALILASDY